MTANAGVAPRPMTFDNSVPGIFAGTQSIVVTAATVSEISGDRGVQGGERRLETDRSEAVELSVSRE
jgi:hypothetical protein